LNLTGVSRDRFNGFYVAQRGLFAYGTAAEVRLKPEDRAVLEARVRAAATEQRDVFRLIAAALGDVHEQQVWRFLRSQKIDLAGRKSWCESNDPELVAKAADVVGLYMAPRRTRSSSVSTKNPRSRPWSVPKGI
jgi:hypothetical protein